MEETETRLKQKARESKCPSCKSTGVRPEQKEGVMTGKMLCLNCRKVF
jgi:hypothetical protein